MKEANKFPHAGDLIELGWDIKAQKPYIGVITEMSEDSVCILINGKKKWCTLKEIKKLSKKKYDQ